MSVSHASRSAVPFTSGYQTSSAVTGAGSVDAFGVDVGILPRHGGLGGGLAQRPARVGVLRVGGDVEGGLRGELRGGARAVARSEEPCHRQQPAIGADDAVITASRTRSPSTRCPRWTAVAPVDSASSLCR